MKYNLNSTIIRVNGYSLDIDKNTEAYFENFQSIASDVLAGQSLVNDRTYFLLLIHTSKSHRRFNFR